MEEKKLKTTKKQRESNKRFDQKTYTYRSVKFRNEELEEILGYCRKNNLSINGFMRESLLNAVRNNK